MRHGAVGHRAFHLIAQSPHQQRGVVFVFADRVADLFALAADLRRVGVVEAMAVVGDPDASGDSEAQLGAAVDQSLAVHALLERLDAPGTNRIAAALLQQG